MIGKNCLVAVCLLWLAFPHTIGVNINLQLSHLRQNLFYFKNPLVSIPGFTAMAGVHSIPENTAVIGNPESGHFWLWNDRDGYDLTRPATPASPPLYPRIKMSTTNSPIAITPNKTALIIVDMQNFFLSTALKRPPDSEGHRAEKALLKHGIPAARKAGIQIIWLTWGVEDGADLDSMLPTMLRIFRFQIAHGRGGIVTRNAGSTQSPHGESDAGSEDRITSGNVGCSIGNVTLEDGSTVDGGRLLMRDAWNTRLHPPLEAAFEEGQKSALPDVRFHKNRLSGMWSASTPLAEHLKKNNFTTLLFSGVNIDQCVLATLQDAVLKGWDCVLLKDGSGTSSPEFAKQATIYNGEQSWGFVSSCEELAKGVGSMELKM